jgi:hypothetical protein
MGVSCSGLEPEAQAWLKEETRRCVEDVGSWERVERADFINKAFLVPKATAPGEPKKWRLVVDLRPLNKFCKKTRMRTETLADLSRIARKNDWMVTFDLQDGYNLLGVERDSRKYMAFRIGEQIFRSSAVPFGWNQSAFAFGEAVRTWTTWMRAPLTVETEEGAEAAAAARAPPRREPLGAKARTGRRARWQDLGPGAARLRGRELRPRRGARHRGMRLLWYVDDLLILGETREEALEMRAFAEASLATLGMSRNPKKGMWEPAQATTHLGLDVDLKAGTFGLTDSRQKKLRRLAAALGAAATRERRWVPARDVARLTGLAQSAYLAIPPARFYLRELHTCLGTKTSWSGRVKLTRQALRDLHWWRDVPTRWRAREMWAKADTAYLHCDASGETGWGGVLNGLRTVQGHWTGDELELHITLKELKAVRFTVERFVAELQGKRVLLWEDNQAVAAILTNVTSRSPALMAELRKLWWLIDTNDIALRAKYIRSAANVWADALSRDRSGQSEWRLAPELFKQIDADWGPHHVDRFATPLNALLPRFNTLMATPTGAAVDALAQSDEEWRSGRSWCHPPWGLLPRVALKLRDSGAAATVLTPTWRSTPWYGELLAMCDSCRIEPARQDLYELGSGRAQHLGPAAWSVTLFNVPLRV